MKNLINKIFLTGTKLVAEILVAVGLISNALSYCLTKYDISKMEKKDVDHAKNYCKILLKDVENQPSSRLFWHIGYDVARDYLIKNSDFNKTTEQK